MGNATIFPGSEGNASIFPGSDGVALDLGGNTYSQSIETQEHKNTKNVKR